MLKKIKSFLNVTFPRPVVLYFVGVFVAGIGIEISYVTGILETLYYNDVTKLSVLMVAILLWQSYSCLSEVKNQCEPIVNDKDTDRILERGWFLSDVLLSLGMVGTVIGFIAMLTGFIDIDFSDAESVQGLIAQLGYGMSTALTTTLVGLISSIILKIQFFMLENLIKENRK
jgi:uncharacterized membrane protein